MQIRYMEQETPQIFDDLTAPAVPTEVDSVAEEQPVLKSGTLLKLYELKKGNAKSTGAEKEFS